MCGPGRKGHDDLTSSPPSSGLSPAVPSECPASPGGNGRWGLRSLKNLISHLTTRADDSHAAPVGRPRRAPGFHRNSSPCQALVRFLAYHRIKPHAPPLVRAPVNSFEFQPCDRTPQVGHLSLSLGRRPSVADNECPSFTAWTTRVSNPVRSPRFRASASMQARPAAFAIGVLWHIYAFHRYTPHSAGLDRIQGPQYHRH